MVSLSWLTSTRRPAILSQQKHASTGAAHCQHQPLGKIQICKSFISTTKFRLPLKLHHHLNNSRRHLNHASSNQQNSNKMQHTDILKSYIELLENEAVIKFNEDLIINSNY